jgi:hypothetical protein
MYAHHTPEGRCYSSLEVPLGHRGQKASTRPPQSPTGKQGSSVQRCAASKRAADENWKTATPLHFKIGCTLVHADT